MALVGIGSGLLLGLLSGGRLSRLENFEIRFAPALLLAFSVQAVVRSGIVQLSRPLTVLVWAICGLIILVALQIESPNPGVRVGTLGVAANLFVVLVNGGMPAAGGMLVDPLQMAAVLEVRGNFYLEQGANTWFGLLGDVVPVFGGLASVGDVIICVGVSVMIASWMRHSVT